MRVLFVTSELQPLAKSGGLADVSKGLPAALAAAGIDVRVLLPAYPGAKAALGHLRIEGRLPSLLGIENATLLSGRVRGFAVPVWLVDAPSLFARGGRLYQDESGRDWADNAERFAFFAHAAAHLCGGLPDKWRPDLVHANDWHAGLLPLLLSLKPGPRPATVFTIHNLAFQGNFPSDTLSRIDVPERIFDTGGIEFYGQLSFMKAAIRYSDRITTVSPRYAVEVLTPEFGCGMDGILRERRECFSGILNGIDTDEWNPGSDEYLPCTYGPQRMSGKQVCKAVLQDELGLESDPGRPLIGFSSRLTHQKMADIVIEAIPSLVAAGAQVAVVGEGDPTFEAALDHAARRNPYKVAVQLGYEECAAHRLQAGADILLAPARFEPCGLIQLYALRYGTVPVARKTGGFVNTVTDATPDTMSGRAATGFLFDEPNLSGLIEATTRAISHFQQPLAWRRLQLNAMKQDLGWKNSAAKYVALYREATGLPASERAPFITDCPPSSPIRVAPEAAVGD